MPNVAAIIKTHNKSYLRATNKGSTDTDIRSFATAERRSSAP